ncbi:ATP-binding protein [Azotosporobacter soli]|uniref:ATP-binding protein n=1 Tax=Azotosporobacter soli TaxID=3055040 RepID=UPI0031FEA5E7
MNYVHLSVISSLFGTLSILLIYLYLYLMYRERYMGIWVASWSILLARYLLFDSGLLPWTQSIFGLGVYQALIILSSSMFVWGTHLFINKPFHQRWLQVTGGVALLTIAGNFFFTSLIDRLLIPVFFGAFLCIWIGLIFIRHLKLAGIGHYLTGYAFILWSLLTLTLPFTVTVPELAPWGYILGAILRLAIAIGTLMVYFEKTRTDLISKEEQYRLLAENAIDIIYHQQLQPESKLTYISPSVFSITGYRPEEYYADPRLVFNRIHSDDRSLFTAFLHDLPHSTQAPLTLRFMRKDTTVLWVEQKCVPIINEHGEVTALEGIIRDISARIKLEQMSAMFDRMNMVGSMAATVAHEIRNPMTTVRGYLQILGRSEKYQPDKDKFHLMIGEIDRANTIIQEYLALSREKSVNFKTHSLNGIIESLFPLLEAHATSSRVSASLVLTPLPELPLDENEIRQLLLNLARNSIEAMPDGGNLVIRTVSNENEIVLSVCDQGMGIPPHVLEYLGTPFVTTKDSGTGLGLPICYQIAHRHNARIRVDTGDNGTTFFVHFTLLS